MLSKGTNHRGRTVYTGTPRDLQMAADWCRALYRAFLGIEEGDRRVRHLRVADALDLWIQTS